MSKIRLSKLRKRKEIFILIILAFVFFITFQSLYFNLTDFTPGVIEEPREKVKTLPHTAEYSSIFNGVGEPINISIHESILNTTDIIFPSLDDKNSFIEPCPTVSGFNSSYIKINITDIFAANRTLNVENEVSSNKHLSEGYYTSFEVRDDCYLEGISVYLNQTSGGDTFYVDIYNATLVPYNATLSHIKFDEDITGPSVFSIYIDAGYSFWANFSVHQWLNRSKTYNNTFFIKLSCLSANNGYWHHGSDGMTYDSIVWRESSGLPEVNTDMSLRLTVTPEDNLANPTDVNLRINGTAVNDTTTSSGYWTTTNELFNPSGKLQFEITADWWDLSCRVSEVQINYTKTDLKGISQFNVPNSGQPVTWNVSRLGGLNYFEAEFVNRKIKFTIPRTWENLSAFNGPINKTDDVSLGPSKNGYRELEVSNAGNGTNWYLMGFSKNLLKKIHTFVNSTESEFGNFIDVVEFLANFSETITNGNINLSIYSPAPGNFLNHTYSNSSIIAASEISLGEWNISLSATEYGKYRIQVFWYNITAAGFLEKTFIIFADTDLTLLSPLDGQIFSYNEILNITVYFFDINQDKGIIGATVTTSSVNLSDTLMEYGGGYYSIFFNTNIYNPGWNYIEINASKSYCYNRSIGFSFYLLFNTTVSPSTINFGTVMRGLNASCTFNYSDILENPIEGAIIDVVSLPPGFSYSTEEKNKGNYSIILHTIGVQPNPTLYTCIFNISSAGFQAQNIYLTIRIISRQSTLSIVSFYNNLFRREGLNQTFIFYYNDTDSKYPINGLTDSDISVKDHNTGLSRPFWLYTTADEGKYILNISMSGLDSGVIRLNINASLYPTYNWSIASISFYLRGNFTEINLGFISDPGGEGLLKLIGQDFSCFIGRDLYIDFNITDLDFNNNLVKTDANSYFIYFTEIGNSSNQGNLAHTLDFSAVSSSYRGTIWTSDLTKVSSYNITIIVSITNYETSQFSFLLEVKAKYQVRLNATKPDLVDPGDVFFILLKAEYLNGTSWLPLIGTTIDITLYFNGRTYSDFLSGITNYTGEILFEITVRNDARDMTALIEIEETYYSSDLSLEIPISINISAPSSGFDLESLIPYLIIIGAVIAVATGIIIAYLKIKSPKRRKIPLVMEDAETVFKDAIKLKHIFVLFKRTGTCIYFKSIVSEEIHPLILSGLISEICSFSKDLKYQERVNRIQLDDNVLLLSDGEYIRVAVVLTEEVSSIFYRNLIEFVNSFEDKYLYELRNWEWEFNAFKDTGVLLEEKLSISINLPHEITEDAFRAENLENPYSKDVLEIANELVFESENNFVDFTMLINMVIKKTQRDTKEIFMGIKELRDKDILVPLEIDDFEAETITAEEMTILKQKVEELADLNPEEKKKIVENLGQTGSVERKVYLTSLIESREIVSASIVESFGASLIGTKKEAKKEIKELMKIAQLARDEKDYNTAISSYRKAIKIATEYELARELEQLNEFLHSTETEKYFNIE